MAILHMSLGPMVLAFCASVALGGPAIAESEGGDRAAPFPAPLEHDLSESAPHGVGWVVADLPDGMVLHFGGDGRGGAQGALYMRTVLGLLIGAQGGISSSPGGAQALVGVKLRF